MSNETEKRTTKRKFISLEEKVQILNRLKDGEKISSVGKSFDLNESTIRTLKRNEEKIRKTMSDGCPLGAKRMTRNRNIDIIKMERDLMVWLEDCIAKNIPVNGNLIRREALQIYNHLREIGDTSEDERKRSSTFSASKGWLENLKKRYSLQSIKFQGEQTAYKFKVDSPGIVEAYKEDFVYSHTLRMCSNLSENLMIKSILTDRTLNLIGMKNIDKTQLLELCSSNNISWMKQNVVKDRLDNYLKIFQRGNDISTPDVEKVNIVSRLTGKEFEDRNHRDVEETSDEEKLVEFINRSTHDGLVEKNMEKKWVENINLSGVKRGLDLGEQLEIYFIENDRSTGRSGKFRKELQKCLAPYREIFLELQNNTTYVNENEDMQSVGGTAFSLLKKNLY